MKMKRAYARAAAMTAASLLFAGLAPPASAQDEAPVLPRAEDRIDWPPPMQDDGRYGRVLFDRLEYARGDSEDTVNWDVNAWYGGDYNRVWFKTEGEDIASGGSGGEANAELLYSRMIAPYWDAQAGIGYETAYGPGPNQDRVSAVFGLQGLAPYWFELNPELWISEDGDVSARLEGEYDLLFTQRLILQPRFETAIAAQDAEEFGVRKGINYVRLGLRLRYEIKREFAPYVGVSWKRSLGDTADLVRSEGEDVSGTWWVAGVRMWF